MKKALSQKITEVDLSKIDEPKAIVRMEIDQERIAELAKSISEIGLLQAITVRPLGDRYEVVFGHRRYLACILLEKKTIRALVKSMTDQEAAVSRATENLARIDLTPIEEAATYRDLIDSYGISIDQVADRVGKTPHVVMRRMDLLKMPSALQKAVHSRLISMTVAEELWPIAEEGALNYYLTFAIENGVTREVARNWCREWRDSQRRKQSPGVESMSPGSPYEPRPNYVACDMCMLPTDLNGSIVYRICPECDGRIKKALQ
ncbi:Nucleoid occlusion protein [subsurface metagenome]